MALSGQKPAGSRGADALHFYCPLAQTGALYPGVGHPVRPAEIRAAHPGASLLHVQTDARQMDVSGLWGEVRPNENHAGADHSNFYLPQAVAKAEGIHPALFPCRR